MKKNASFKNVVDVLLATFFVSWLFFEIIILGNKFDIFHYSGLSGKLIVLFGEVSPLIATYMLLTIWKDISSAFDYVKTIFQEESILRTSVVLVIFTVLHTFVAVLGGRDIGHKPAYFIIAIPLAVVSFGLAESAWMGIVYPGVKRVLPAPLACIAVGFMKGCYFIPMWSIKGTEIRKYEFPYFLIYCVFINLLLGAIYRMTESVFACMAFQTVAGTLSIYYGGLMFDRPKATVLYIAELIVVGAVLLVWKKMEKVSDDKPLKDEPEVIE